MRACKHSDHEIVDAVAAYGPTGAAKMLGVNLRSLQRRLRGIESRGGFTLKQSPAVPPQSLYPHRYDIQINNGYVIVGSDFHIWPGDNGPALRAFKKFIDDMRPAAVILNGDVLDFPSISRHPPIGWETAPTPQEEIEAAQDHLSDIARAARRAHKVWPLGNHDARFETRLAAVAPEFARVSGIHLSDHFPLWEKCWSARVNNNTVVKHRFKGGIHAAHNNTLWAGMHMVTGHLHSLKVTPLTDYNGTRYGVDCGCVADTHNKAFVNYTEDSPLNWRSGFVVLTYVDRLLLMPELVQVWDEKHVQFRGKLIKV